MRRVSANYVLSPHCEPIRNGILEFNKKGVLVEIIDPKEAELAQVEWYNGVLIPGFVNAHCHLELSQLKGVIPAKQGMTGFIKGIFANNGKQPFDQQSAIEADKMMFREGVVAVGDISNHIKSLSIKLNSSLYYHTFFEALGLNPETASATKENLVRLIETAHNLTLNASASPHAFYSMSEQLWQELHPLFKDQVVSFHHLESTDEALFIEKQTGELFNLMRCMSPGKLPATPALSMANLLLRYLSEASKLLLIHNGALTTKDLALYNALQTELYFVLCPCSNQYIGNALPDYEILKQFNATLCIGTDSLSSNTQLSICEEMKALQAYYPEVTFMEILSWATLNGAKALGISDSIGSFEVGKKPGAVLISHFDFENTRLTSKSTARRLL